MAALGSPAIAHAYEAPAGLALAWTDAAPDALPVVLSNRGLVFPREDASVLRFSLRCNESYHVPSVARPSLLATPFGDVVLQTTVAISHSNDRGCSFRTGRGLPESLPLGGFAQNPKTPAQLLVTTQTYEADSQILASDDYGATWTARSVNADLSVYGRLLFAADGSRLYASGERYDEGERALVPIWAVSDDAGKTFRDRDQPRPRAPIGAHPTEADVVWARETASTGLSNPHDTVLRSIDGSSTFTEVLALTGRVTSFAISPDAAHVFIGTDTVGLWMSNDGGTSFERVDATQILSVTCLQYRQNRLWMCATMAPNIHGVYVSADGARFTAKLTFDQVREPIACGPASDAICDAPWQAWERERLSEPTTTAVRTSGPDIIVGVYPPSQARSSDVTLHNGGRAPSEVTDGCALRREDAGSNALSALLALLALIGLRRRRS